MELSLYQDDMEQSQHEDAINRLCELYPEQCEQIEQSYLENLKDLLSGATIRTYLPIFVSRKVKETLTSEV
ncbi:MAG: hypothetical protein C0622_06930 [Desulfuromonas sp.]|nr:MAG: hypothetical protein C0622_06930 [Desulfuromonas sp.]